MGKIVQNTRSCFSKHHVRGVKSKTHPHSGGENLQVALMSETDVNYLGSIYL